MNILPHKEDPQELLAHHPLVAGWLEAYAEAFEEEELAPPALGEEVVASFDDNLHDMSKDDAVEALWSLIGSILESFPGEPEPPSDAIFSAR